MTENRMRKTSAKKTEIERDSHCHCVNGKEKREEKISQIQKLTGNCGHTHTIRCVTTAIADALMENFFNLKANK